MFTHSSVASNTTYWCPEKEAYLFWNYWHTKCICSYQWPNQRGTVNTTWHGERSHLSPVSTVWEKLRWISQYANQTVATVHLRLDLPVSHTHKHTTVTDYASNQKFTKQQTVQNSLILAIISNALCTEDSNIACPPIINFTSNNSRSTCHFPVYHFEHQQIPAQNNFKCPCPPTDFNRGLCSSTKHAHAHTLLTIHGIVQPRRHSVFKET